MQQTLEKEIFEPIFYQHTEPDPVYYGDINMPMTVEQPDSQVGGQQILVEDGNGGERPLTQAEAMGLMNSGVPDGINVPGYIQPGSRPPQAPQRIQQPQQAQRPQQAQQRPQQPQQAPQQDQQNQKVQQRQEQTKPEDLVPPTEMAMVDGEYHVFVDLPGVSKEDLKILYDNGTLTIEGRRETSVDNLKKELKSAKLRKNIKEATSTVPNFLMGKFSYKYYFKRLVDETNISAKYTDGILHVTLPHRSKGEQIQIALM